MAPRTRSARGAETVPGPSSSANGTHPRTLSEDDPFHDVEDQLSNAVRSFRKVKKEWAELKEKNEELEEELKQAREATEHVDGSKGRNGTSDIRTLRRQVVQLESKNKKLEKKLRVMKHKEVKREARDLQEDGDDELIDSAHQLRKLLRRFLDLMVANSLEGSEECGICMEHLEVNASVSFPCQHIVCEDCFKMLQPSKELIICPHCRKECPRDDVETVTYTASKQWDELLAVANRFAKIDRRREEETSEEEAEEDFIDDPRSETTTEPSHHELENIPDDQSEHQEPHSDAGKPDRLPVVTKKRRAVESSELSSIASEGENGMELEPIAGPATITDTSRQTPERKEIIPFAQSPSVEKRKRLQQLAEMRESKRRRR